MDASLQYYMHINPAKLTDDEWCAQIAYLIKIRQEEAKAKE